MTESQILPIAEPTDLWYNRDIPISMAGVVFASGAAFLGKPPSGANATSFCLIGWSPATRRRHAVKMKVGIDYSRECGTMLRDSLLRKPPLPSCLLVSTPLHDTAGNELPIQT